MDAIKNYNLSKIDKDLKDVENIVLKRRILLDGRVKVIIRFIKKEVENIYPDDESADADLAYLIRNKKFTVESSDGSMPARQSKFLWYEILNVKCNCGNRMKDIDIMMKKCTKCKVELKKITLSIEGFKNVASMIEILQDRAGYFSR